MVISPTTGTGMNTQDLFQARSTLKKAGLTPADIGGVTANNWKNPANMQKVADGLAKNGIIIKLPDGTYQTTAAGRSGWSAMDASIMQGASKITTGNNPYGDTSGVTGNPSTITSPYQQPVQTKPTTTVTGTTPQGNPSPLSNPSPVTTPQGNTVTGSPVPQQTPTLTPAQVLATTLAQNQQATPNQQAPANPQGTMPVTPTSVLPNLPTSTGQALASPTATTTNPAGGLATTPNEASANAQQILAEAELQKQLSGQTATSDAAQRARSITDLSNTLATNQMNLFNRAIPDLAEQANTAGMYRSTGFGDILARKYAGLTQDTQTQLALQGLSDRNTNIGQTDTAQNNYLSARSGALNRQFSLGDFSRQVEAGQKLGFAATPVASSTGQSGKGVGAAVGTAAGAFAGKHGGPAGVTAGASVGSQIGNALGF
jgi:hypothetical protein